MERNTTGVPGLDEALQGGFVRGSVTLVSGPVGSGKTTMALQYLMAGAQSSEPGMFISLDYTRKQLFEQADSFGWDLEALEKKKLFLFLEYPPHEAEHFLSQEMIIRDAIEENGVKRIAIDNVTPIGLFYETEFKQRQETGRLFSKLRAWGATSLVTCETIFDQRGKASARFGVDTLADAVFLLNIETKDGVYERDLEIVKMRATSTQTRKLPIVFKKNGLSLQK